MPEPLTAKNVRRNPGRGPEILQQIAEASGQGFLLADATGILWLVNGEAQRQFGTSFDPESPLPAADWARGLLYATDGKPLPAAETPLSRAVAGEFVDRARFNVRRPNGTTRLLSGSSTLLYNDDGSSAGAVLVTADETERIEQERKLRFQGSVLRNVRDSIVVTDMTGHIVEWNEGARLIFGYSAEEALGKTPALLYPEVDPEALARDLASIAQGEDFVGAWKGRHRDGAPVWVELRTTLLLDDFNQPMGYVGIGKDATARKLAELARERADEQRSEALTLAESAVRAKDEFLAMLGHELRNPLSPIVTALRLMKLKSNGALSKEYQVIERQVDHLIRLVDDLLDVSRVTRGTFELKKERLDFAGVVAKAVEMAGPLLEQRQHHLHVKIHPIRLEADPIRLAQVIANLLTNAAKYTEPGGTISLNAWREGGEVVILVKDNGMGIAQELLPRLFDLFIQGQTSKDRPQGGLGIGLTLVQQLVHMHGGTVVAQSEGPGKGSEFIVRLPALADDGTPATDAAQVGGARTQSRPTRTPHRVLIVDDNSDAAELLAALLREVGHDVRVAEDGPRALKVLERFTPQVALLDIGLPVMDGYELAARIRATLSDSVRLAAVTGYGQARDRAMSATSGFDQHFVKPVDPDLIMGYIDQT